MDFTVERGALPSEVHAQVYWAARSQTPLERSLEGVPGPLRGDCSAYRAFVMDMLSDMHDHPEAYSLPAGELEAFLHGRKLNAAKQQEPAKALRLYSHARNAAEGYIGLLYLIGQRGVEEDGGLRVSAEDMADIAKRTKSTNSPIPLDARLRGLARVGLTQEDGLFVAPDRPGMLRGMQALAKAAPKRNGFLYFAFANCEFRNLVKPYKPGFEDYVQPLFPDQRRMAERMHETALALGLKPAVNTFWKVDYKYKGAQVMCLSTEMCELGIRVVGTYNWDDPALINDQLAAEGADFQRYILRHIWGCTACSTNHLGGFVTILGKRRRVCGGSMIGFRWSDPGESDLESIEKVLKMRCRVIDQVKKKEGAK